MPVNKTDRLSVIFVIVVVFSLVWLSLGFWDLRQDNIELKTYYNDKTNDPLNLQSAPILESSKIKLIKTDKGIYLDFNQGSGSELDADELDGKDTAYFLDVSNLNTGVLKTSLYSAIEDLEEEGYIVDGKWVNTSYDSSSIDLDLWKGSSNLTKVGTIVTGRWNGEAITSQFIADKTIELIDLGKNGCANSQVIKWNDLQDKWVCADDEQSNLGSITWNDIQNRPGGLDDGDDDTDTVLTESQVETYIINGSINLNSASQVGGEQIASRNWVSSQGYLTTYTETDPGLSTWTGSSNISTVGTITSGTWNGTAFTSSNIQDGSLTLADLGQNGCAAGQVIKWNASPAGWICANDLEGIASVDWSSILNRPAGLDDGDDDTVLTEGQVETYITNSSINLATGSQVNSENIATQNWVGSQGYMTSYTETDPGLTTWTGSSNISTVGTITSGTWNGTAFTSSNIQDGSLTLADLGQNGCSDGQVMKWNTIANAWICANDLNDGSTGGSSIYDKWDPDAPSTAPSIYDDEFTETIISTDWSQEGAGIATQEDGTLKFKTNNKYFYKTLPSGDFTIWTKLSKSGFPQFVNYSQTLLSVQVGTGTIWSVGLTAMNTNITKIEVIQWSNFLTHVSTPVGIGGMSMNHLYVSIRRTGTTLSFWVSDDGVTYNRVYTVSDPGVTRMGLIRGGSTLSVFDYFRYEAVYHDENWNPPGDMVSQGGAGGGSTYLSPITSQGDLIIGDATGTDSRLAKGTAGQVLTVDETGTTLGWSNPTIPITWDATASTEGVDQNRSTSGSFTRFTGRLHVIVPLQISQIKWDIRVNGTYTLRLSSGSSDVSVRDLFVSKIVTTAPDEITFDFSGDPVVLASGVYYLQLKSLGGAVQWNDYDAPDVYNSQFFIDDNWYDDTLYTNFNIPIKLVAKKGTWESSLPVADPPGITWARAYGTTDVSKSTATWEDMPDMTLNMTTGASPVELNFSAGVGNSLGGGVGIYRLLIDGVVVGTQGKTRVASASVGSVVTLIWIENLSAGPHTFKVQWNAESGTLYNRAAAGNEHRTFIVKEY